jgi:hypothetical protein
MSHHHNKGLQQCLRERKKKFFKEKMRHAKHHRKNGELALSDFTIYHRNSGESARKKKKKKERKKELVH